MYEMEIARNRFYDFAQEVYAPQYYYSEKVKKDEYSKKIVFSKAENKSYIFLKPVKELIADLRKKGFFIDLDLITIIPRSKIGQYSVTLNRIAESISKYLLAPYERIIERTRNTHPSGTRPDSLEERYNDVKTTGCNILEVKKLLLLERVENIICVCFGINRDAILHELDKLLGVKK